MLYGPARRMRNVDSVSQSAGVDSVPQPLPLSPKHTRTYTNTLAHAHTVMKLLIKSRTYFMVFFSLSVNYFNLNLYPKYQHTDTHTHTTGETRAVTEI